jgi:mono/diheme cytochrome c family protein
MAKAMAILRLGAIALLLLVGTAQAEDLGAYTGAQLYTRFCAACHGDTAHGDGVVAPFFKLHPPDLTQIAKRHGGKFPADEVMKIIDGREARAPHGTREMPVWGLEFYETDTTHPNSAKQVGDMLTKLVDYLRSIQVKPEPAS